MADDVNQSCSSERLGDGEVMGKQELVYIKLLACVVMCSGVRKPICSTHRIYLTFICSCPDVMRPGSLVVAVVVVAAAAGVVAR